MSTARAARRPPLPRRVHGYVVVVVVGSLLALPLSGIADGRVHGPVAVLDALVLAVLIASAHRGAVALAPHHKLNAATAPEVAAVLLLPGPLAVLTLVVGVMAGETRRQPRQRPVQRVFNVAVCVVRVVVGSLTVVTIPRLLGPEAIATPVAALAAATAMYLSTTLLVRGIVAVQSRQPPWHRTALPAGRVVLAEAALSVSGIVAATAAEQHPWVLPLVAVPARAVHRSLHDALEVRTQARQMQHELVERRRLEEQLAHQFRAMEQSRNYLQTLLDRMHVAVLVLDPIGGRLRNINADGATLLGLDRDEALQQRVVDVAPPDDHAAWQSLLDEAPTGGDAAQRALHLVARDGTTIPLDVTGFRLDVDDEPAVVCLARDQRPRIRHEEEERLRALGEMASGVAHDFNNMLGVILGRTSLMLRRVARDDPAMQVDLAVIKQATLDGEQTVKRLQAFSGVSRLHRHEVTEVTKVLNDAVEFTRPRWRDAAQQRGVTIEVVALPGHTPPVAGGAAELREVLVNLVFNAVDAMPRGGQITLRSWAEGDRVFVSVADTGTGMLEAVRNRVFEPFYTTKGARGTGLGLSASHGIITRLGGQLTVESTPEHGTTFMIELPVSEPVGEPAADIPMLPSIPSGPLRVLLVDDEPRVLRTTKMMLEAEGHAVTAVPGGRAALDALDKQGYDVMLTDLGMPELNGLQLTEMMRASGHTIPVLLVTGWGMELEAERVHAVGVTDILPKPFDGERLRAKLAAVTSTVVTSASPRPPIPTKPAPLAERDVTSETLVAPQAPGHR